MRNRWWALPAAAGAAALIAACGGSGGGSATSGGASGAYGNSPAASPAHTQAGAATKASAATIGTRHTSVGTILVTSKGDTIYWFAIDTATMSKCTGSCATYWPPVLGKVTPAPGTTLPHGFGTITRAGGQVQATYDGHPLYTYAADGAPGQVQGNGLNASGGLWWAMTPSGAKAAPATSSSSSSSGGGW
jgi:predicted lipoprotein with Yx(FWY)xxD motif